jgi:hypothetical protein
MPWHGSAQLAQPRTSSALPHEGSGRQLPVEGSVANQVLPHESAWQRCEAHTSELPHSFEV